MSGVDAVQAVAEMVAIHTPELVQLAPDGVSDGQHLYCIECGVLPLDALAQQHGPEHVAEFAVAAARPAIEREAKVAAWDEVSRALAWLLDNGPAGSAPAYLRGHNPYRIEQEAAHDCETCRDCLHNGARCCGCYDGACCIEREGQAE